MSSSSSSSSDAMAKKIAKINNLIAQTKVDFASCFNELVLGLHALYPDKRYKVASVANLLAKEQLDMEEVSTWYADNLCEHSAQIFNLTMETGIPEKDATLNILPGVPARAFLYPTFNPQAENRERTQQALALIVGNLPRLFMWSQMLQQISNSRQDISSLSQIIVRSYDMQKSWKERREREHRVLSTSNLRQNCSHMPIGIQRTELFATEQSTALNPIMKTMIKMVVYQTGLNSSVLDPATFNSILSKATDEKIEDTADQLSDFLITVGLQRYLKDGGKIEDIAERRKLRVVMQPSSLHALEAASAIPGAVVEESKRRIRVVRFVATAAELPRYRARPECRIKDNIVVLPIENKEEHDREMALPGRESGYIEIPLPLVTYTTTEQADMTDEAISNLESSGAKTTLSYRIRDSGRVTMEKELEASEIAREIMTMVMNQIKSLPEEQEPLDRVFKTFDVLSARLKDEPRYKNFSIRDVFIAIMVYAKNEPIVSSNPKLLAVVEKIQHFAANIKVPTPEEVQEAQQAALAGKPVPFDPTELNEVKDIVLMALDASGNNTEKHTSLVDRSFQCIIDFKNGEMKPSEAAELVQIAMTDGFFRTDIAKSMIEGVIPMGTEDSEADE